MTFKAFWDYMEDIAVHFLKSKVDSSLIQHTSWTSVARDLGGAESHFFFQVVNIFLTTFFDRIQVL